MKSRSVITLAAAAALLAACGGTSTSDGQSAGGSAGSGNAAGTGGESGGGAGGGVGECPDSFPQHGSACPKLATALICSYDSGPCCSAAQASCVDGTWQAYESLCSPPAPACPLEPPIDGSACGSECGGSYQYCTYGTCSDGSPAVVAQCQGSTWSTSQANCLPSCDGLSPCECFARSDCQAVSDFCICPCDYECPGEPPCACACGGGNYLGCSSIADAGG
jgi:hypothetical protein